MYLHKYAIASPCRKFFFFKKKGRSCRRHFIKVFFEQLFSPYFFFSFRNQPSTDTTIIKLGAHQNSGFAKLEKERKKSTIFRTGEGGRGKGNCVCVCVCGCVCVNLLVSFHLAFFSSFRVTSRGIECDVCTDGKEKYCHINPGGRVGGMILGWIGV